jgi:hypothetical protein
MLTCKGFALIFVAVTCQPAEAPTGRASFCDVMNQSGGAFYWSRNDTRTSKARADKLNAQYNALRCSRQEPVAK